MRACVRAASTGHRIYAVFFQKYTYLVTYNCMTKSTLWNLSNLDLCSGFYQIVLSMPRLTKLDMQEAGTDRFFGREGGGGKERLVRSGKKPLPPSSRRLQKIFFTTHHFSLPLQAVHAFFSCTLTGDRTPLLGGTLFTFFRCSWLHWGAGGFGDWPCSSRSKKVGRFWLAHSLGYRPKSVRIFILVQNSEEFAEKVISPKKSTTLARLSNLSSCIKLTLLPRLRNFFCFFRPEFSDRLGTKWRLGEVLLQMVKGDKAGRAKLRGKLRSKIRGKKQTKENE